MNDENDQLPTARMMTINKRSFWIYFLACAVLFACYMFQPHQPVSGWLIPSLIGLSVFVVLLLELLSQSIKNTSIVYWLTNASYVLEVGSVIAFVFIIFGR